MHKFTIFLISLLPFCGVDCFAQFTTDNSSAAAQVKNDNNDDSDTFHRMDYRTMSIRLGISAGADFSTMSSSDASYNPSFGFSTGVNGGVLANFRFLKRGSNGSVDAGILAFQPEIRYAMMGAKVEDESLNLGYVTGGLMFQAYPIRDLFIEIGAHYGYNISHSPEELKINSSTTANFKDLKANNVYLAAGLGYTIKGFGIGVRYLYGFSPIADNLKWKNSCIQLNLSYAFLLNKFSR